VTDPYQAFAYWLTQREARDHAITTPATDTHDHRNRLPGDPFSLRGYPLGIRGGIGGCYPNDMPGHPQAVRRATESQWL
jgi:hypothetical protein